MQKNLNKQELAERIGLQFDEVKDIFSVETLASMEMMLVSGGETPVMKDNGCSFTICTNDGPCYHGACQHIGCTHSEACNDSVCFFWTPVPTPTPTPTPGPVIPFFYCS